MLIGRCRFYLQALKFCFSRSATAVDRNMQILSASFKVLFQQVFNCCVLCIGRCRFYLLDLKFCFSRSLTAVNRMMQISKF